MRNKLSNVLWGLFFVVIGVGFAGNVLFDWDFTILFHGWWTLFIIIPCFISMVQNGFGTGSTVGFIIGILLLASYYVDLNFSIWKLIIPAILIFIGLRIMFNGAFRKKINYNMNYNTDGTTGPGPMPGPQFSGAAKSEYSAIFSSNKVHVSDTFTGTSLNAVFGGIVLDLRDAKLPGDVEINAQAIFGGIDIYVPAGVKVKVNNVPVFGGVSNKSSQYTDPAAPTIYLNSTCMFGGIDIK
jgi:predicted membrane protein